MTYSIVARDSASGALGVAVQSHYFSVGSVVPWAQPGVGAVATQANAEVRFGPRGLAGLAAGHAPGELLAELLAGDPAAASRQLALVDVAGRAAAHTGENCIAAAGHAIGDGVSCQANMMLRPGVPEAMLAAYEGASGALEQRLLAALDAGEAAGGDIRGRQSAAVLVVPAAGESWETVVSLRVEDAPEPLDELRRLLGMRGGYAVAFEADELAAQGRHEEAAAHFRRAGELLPGNPELRFWAAIAAADAGETTGALDELRALIAVHPPWGELLARLPPELAPSARVLHAQLED